MKLLSIALTLVLLVSCKIERNKGPDASQIPIRGIDELSSAEQAFGLKVCKVLDSKRIDFLRSHVGRTFRYSFVHDNCGLVEPRGESYDIRLLESNGQLTWERPANYTGLFFDQEVTSVSAPFNTYCPGILSGRDKSNVRMDGMRKAVLSLEKDARGAVRAQLEFSINNGASFVYESTQTFLIRVSEVFQDDFNGLILQRTLTRSCPLDGTRLNAFTQTLSETIP